MKNIKLGLAEVSEERLVAFDDVIAVRFIPVWKALSTEHRKALKAKITEVTKRALTSKEVKDFWGIIQQKRGYKITRNLDQSNKAAEQFIEELQSQTTLNDF